MLTSLVWASPADVQELTSEMVVDGDGWSASLKTMVLPGEEEFPLGEQVCVHRWSAVEGGLVVSSTCEGERAARFQKEQALWQVDLTGAPKSDRVLFEVWSVSASKGQPGQLLVRQEADTTIKMHDKRLSLLSTDLRRVSDLTMEAPKEEQSCVVRIDLTGNGIPEDVEVTDCEEPVKSALEGSVYRWIFLPNRVNGVASPTGWSGRVVVHPDGKLEVVKPKAPDLGDRGSEVVAELPVDSWGEPPPMPTWEPLFVLDHKSYAEVEVYSLVFPKGAPNLTESKSCDLLVASHSDRRVFVWAEECDEEVHDRSLAAVRMFNLKPGKIQPGERYARFRMTMVYGPDETVLFRIPSLDIVSKGKLPERVHTYEKGRLVKRKAPKMPNAFATEVLGKVSCVLDVSVGPTGRVKDLSVIQGCEGGYEPYAMKAVRKWRWEPAREGNRAVPFNTKVRVRFD